MPLPEGYLPRKGDLISVQGTVKWDVEFNDPYIHIDVDGKTLTLEPDKVSLVRRRWANGEKVQLSDSFWPEPGIVIAIVDDFVWVKDPSNGEPITYPANSLKEWRDPKAPLEVDEQFLREDQVAAAMQEPAEPPPETPTVAEITRVDPPPVRAMPDHCYEI